MTSIAPTHRVSFAIGDEHAAKGVVDALTEVFFEGQAAIAAFERPDGRWDVTVHFAEPPDQPLVRELVANAAGADIAEGIVFDTVEAKDWVKASLEDLVPVPAGRFIVHGQHDRERIAPNKIGIEIEAALAFGTGHHGTTRGCLLLLDHVLKAWRPRRVLDLGTGTGVLAIAAARALHRKGAGERHRSAIGAGRPRKCAAERGGASGAGDPRHRLRGAAIRCMPRRSTWCWRIFSPIRCGNWQAPMARHLAPSALVILSGLLTHSGARRHRRLSRARAGAGAASADRRLEQPVAAQGELRISTRWVGAGLRAITPFSSFNVRLTRASANRSSIWTINAALLLVGDGRNRAAVRPAAKSSQT